MLNAMKANPGVLETFIADLKDIPELRDFAIAILNPT
jgi:hypothetical protein